MPHGRLIRLEADADHAVAHLHLRLRSTRSREDLLQPLLHATDQLLGGQIVGVLIEFCWVSVMSTLLFLGLKMMGILRTPAGVERAGMDVSKHGGHAYPMDDVGNA